MHSFLFMSLFLFSSQVHWEARADAGICLNLQHFTKSLKLCRNMNISSIVSICLVVQESCHVVLGDPLKLMLNNKVLHIEILGCYKK